MPLDAASRSDFSRETGVLVEEAVISLKDLLSITLLPNLKFKLSVISQLRAILPT
jgi:hypothetical protein